MPKFLCGCEPGQSGSDHDDVVLFLEHVGLLSARFQAAVIDGVNC